MNKIAVVYTDGSSRGNPGPGGYGTVCIFQDWNDHMQATELGGAEQLTTNNRMEIMAVIEGLEYLHGFTRTWKPGDVHVYSDSGYVLKGIQKWIHGWKANNWITSSKEAVKNADLWKRLDEAVSNLAKGGASMHWHQLKGHAGIAGNERCDEIATSFADGKPRALHAGFLSEYDLAHELEKNGMPISASKSSALSGEMHKGSKTNPLSAPRTSGSSSNKGKPAYSYVSYVDGVLHVDKTWADCERRVKGKSGAKFKKSISAADEARIRDEFVG